jgi:hypothetical protein
LDYLSFSNRDDALNPGFVKWLKKSDLPKRWRKNKTLQQKIKYHITLFVLSWCFRYLRTRLWHSKSDLPPKKIRNKTRKLTLKPYSDLSHGFSSSSSVVQQESIPNVHPYWACVPLLFSYQPLTWIDFPDILFSPPFFFPEQGVPAQGLTRAKQALYHWAKLQPLAATPWSCVGKTVGHLHSRSRIGMWHIGTMLIDSLGIPIPGLILAFYYKRFSHQGSFSSCVQSEQ